jgi:hypothetical protein
MHVYIVIKSLCTNIYYYSLIQVGCHPCVVHLAWCVTHHTPDLVVRFKYSRCYAIFTGKYYSSQKVMQHVFFLGPIVFEENDILHAAAFKYPAFIHTGARFPTRR